MRAAKTKHSITLLDMNQGAMLDLIERSDFFAIAELDEQQAYLCDQMYKLGVLRKVKRGDQIGYKSYKETL